MNLDQISIKNFILALFKRDDGERILLGSGAYEFDAELQHFAANIIANDVVEKQGTDGQLLAGQVRRCAPQSFDGYVGDATTTREDTENYRRAFIRFFQPRHFYTVIYILPDGTAIQRKNGYLTDAPAVPEQYQKSPRYHVALAFEDLNYYSYAEDAQGEETYAQTVDLQPESELTGGLVWDAIGTVWAPESKRLTGINGDTFQQSYDGKNLCDYTNAMYPYSGYGITAVLNGDGSITVDGLPTKSYIVIVQKDITDILEDGATYTISCDNYGADLYLDIVGQRSGGGSTYPANTRSGAASFTVNKADIESYEFRIETYTMGSWGESSKTITRKFQLEKGATASAFEPFVGGQPSPNPDYPQPIQMVVGAQTITIDDTDYPLDLGDIELCGLGDDGAGGLLYKDRIYRDGTDWKVHKATGSYTFDGTEAWAWDDGRIPRIYLTSAGLGALNIHARIPSSSAVLPVGLINEFTPKAFIDFYTNSQGNGFAMSTTGKNFQLGDNGWTSRDDAIAAIVGTKWLYALATGYETDTVITDTNLITQLEAISEALGSGSTPTITPAQGNLPAILITESTIVSGGAVWDAETGHATTTFTVNGLYAVNPIWTVPGPAESPLIENTTNGTSLSYLGQIPAGQSLIIDCGNQTATLAGANVKNNVRGTWQAFEPGQITIRYTGANITGPSNLKWNEVVG